MIMGDICPFLSVHTCRHTYMCAHTCTHAHTHMSVRCPPCHRKGHSWE